MTMFPTNDTELIQDGGGPDHTCEAYLLTEKRKTLAQVIHELTTNHPKNRSELNTWTS